MSPSPCVSHPVPGLVAQIRAQSRERCPPTQHPPRQAALGSWGPRGHDAGWLWARASVPGQTGGATFTKGLQLVLGTAEDVKAGQGAEDGSAVASGAVRKGLSEDQATAGNEHGA